MLKRLTTIMVALLVAGGACKKESQETPAADPKVASSDPAPAQPAEPAPDPAAAAEAEEKRKQAEELAKELKKFEEEAAVEAKRWTDDLKKKASDLVARKFKSSKEALKAITASPHRLPGNGERDRYRHPIETLTFFGIEPSMTVVEVGSGAGWFTEILAPLLAREGKLVAVSYDPNGPPDSGRTVYGKRTQMFLARSPELFGKVEVAHIDPPSKIELGAPGSADLVLAIREMHNWQSGGHIDAYLAAMHEVLKDGGKLGVVQHRARPDARAEESAEMGYLPEAWLIAKIESAGFKLEQKSKVNDNPKDTKDYAKGVWTLPPTYDEGEKDKEKYKAIGESDRMTLRFVKTAAATR